MLPFLLERAMARIFLSYAREDAATAMSIAKALERAGHQVWWDSHVHGGAKFATEIAEALKNSEVVVVLWSRSSVQSTWVQDEAADGRDRGRLVPVSLDGTQPPLGFRQFQSLDLSGWSGRRNSSVFAALQQSIAAVLEGERLPEPPPQPPKAGWRSWQAKATAALAGVLLLAGVFFYSNGRLLASTPEPTLAVMAFDDLSPGKDKAYFAEGVADEIRTLLSDVPNVRVIGRSSIDMLGEDAGFKEARAKLGATHMLEGSMRVHGDQLRLNASLVRTSDGVQLWSERFDRQLGDVFAVQDEVGQAVAGRLRRSLWGNPLQARSTRTAVEVLDLVLAAEAKWERWTEEGAFEAERLLKRAVEIDPSYAPAWVARSRNMHVLIGSRPEGVWGPTWLRDRELMLRYARRAVEVDPEHADGQAFLGYLEGNKVDPEAGLARIERAIQLNPGDWRVWGLASLILGQLCEHEREYQAVRRVIALEPLDLNAQADLMWHLYATGEKREADALRRKLSQDPQRARNIARTFAIQRGDYSAVLPDFLDPKQAIGDRRIRAAHMLWALRATDSAVAVMPSDYRKSLGAYWKRDYRRAAAEAGWLRQGYWNSARGFAITRAMARAGRHRDLLRLFDQRFGSVEEFDRRLRCYVPALAPPLVMALRESGRAGEAERLIAFAERRFRQGLRERHGDEDMYVGYVETLVLAGRRSDALAELERTVRRAGVRSGPPPISRIDLADPVFDPIRNHPRFKAVERFVAAWRAKELRELAAAGVSV